MVSGVGGVNSFSDMPEYQVYYGMYQNYLRNNPGSNISFEAYMRMKGGMEVFEQDLENMIESKESDVIDGKNGNTLNSMSHVSSASGGLYQTADDEGFYEFDFDAGTYRKITGKEEAAKALGLPDDNNVDTINLGYQSATITDYTFGNLDDGQDSTSYRVNGGKYSNVVYTNQEFDVHYILNALLMDPTDPQYQIASQIFNDLCANMNQWLPVSEQQELDEIANQYGTNSAEYKAKLQEVILKNLDQANEWVEEHTHVENPNNTTLEEIENSQKPDGTEGTEGTEGSEETTAPPEYNKESVLNSSGMLSEYTKGQWTSDKVSWKSDAGKDTDKCREMAKEKAIEYGTNVLNSVEQALIAQLGDSCTDEIKGYIDKAKTSVLTNTSNWLSTEWHSAMLGKNRGFTATCNTKALVDSFFTEFDTLCQNGGKTAAEVEADKKAEEEKKAKETEGYKTLYNMNMKDTAKDAGIDPSKDIQVVNVSSAAEIQEKAQQEILDPLAAKIKEKLKDSGIPSSDIDLILNNCIKASLSNCSSWATTSNNYVYTIDTDKLIDIFESNVKQAVKNKGYNF